MVGKDKDAKTWSASASRGRWGLGGERGRGREGRQGEGGNRKGREGEKSQFSDVATSVKRLVQRERTKKEYICGREGNEERGSGAGNTAQGLLAACEGQPNERSLVVAPAGCSGERRSRDRNDEARRLDRSNPTQAGSPKTELLVREALSSPALRSRLATRRLPGHHHAKQNRTVFWVRIVFRRAPVRDCSIHLVSLNSWVLPRLVKIRCFLEG